MKTGWGGAIGRALASGAAGSVASSLALALAARAEGKGALRPVNATSHWLHGDRAAAVARADWAHTAVGYATHHAATVFWAVFLERWIGPRRPQPPLPVLGRALAVSALAVAVDYGATPRRFTPGWELVLSKRSMAAVYVAMGAGMAAGALIASGRNRS